MNTSAQIMTNVPLASIAPVVITAVIVAVGVIAAKVVKSEMAERRERHLLGMDANPELAPLGMPMPYTASKRDNRINTGEILRNENFAV